MRCYLSNIRPQWPIDRQEATLDAKVPGWRKGAVYTDTVTRARIARQTGLTERDTALLRPHGRAAGDTVYVASLSVLAWTPTDLMAVLMRLAARRDRLVGLAEGVEIDPADADLDAVRAAFQGAIRRFSAAGVTGGKASGQKRSAAAQAKIEQMRPYWGLPSPEYPTAALCERFAISRPTAILYLGSRRAAQQKHEAGAKIAASNRRRKQRGQA